MYIISSTTLVTTSNTNNNLIKSTKLVINSNGSSFLNQPQSLQITLNFTNNLNTGDYITITLPSQYEFIGTSITVAMNTNLSAQISSSLCSGTTYFCSNYNSFPNIVKIEELTKGLNTFNNLSYFVVEIKNMTYVSPKNWNDYNSESFLATTYTSTESSIDSVQAGSITANFYLTCGDINNCRQCDTSLKCTSCYQIGNGHDPNFDFGTYFYRTSTGRCVKQCEINFFNLSNFCQICQSPCYTCSKVDTNCTSCDNSSSYPYYVPSTNSCGSKCIDGYYADASKICKVCSSNCLKCDILPTNCTECSILYLSISNTCVNSSSC